jgi:hypothetical protein
LGSGNSCPQLISPFGKEGFVVVDPVGDRNSVAILIAVLASPYRHARLAAFTSDAKPCSISLIFDERNDARLIHDWIFEL